MANIDVSQLMLDPDFVDVITLTTQSTAVNSRGENLLSPAKVVTSVGSVQPASGKTLQRLPDGMQLEDVRSFFYKGDIIASEPGKYSSVLEFRGQRYLVRMVMNWNNYGAGWSEGICVAERAT